MTHVAGHVEFAGESAEAAFYRSRAALAGVELENARAEVAALRRRLRKALDVLQRCIPGDNQVANERHEVLRKDFPPIMKK